MTSEATVAAGPVRHEADTAEAPLDRSRRQSPSRRFEIAPHNCFACGQLNLNGLHLDLHAGADRCWTELALPRQFEGWEGVVHGGIVSTILDEVMAWALVDHDLWGVTARMSVDFRRPVLVDVPVRAEGWVVSARRRLIDTAAEIRDPASGEVLAMAEGRYVSVGDDRKRELRERYQVRLVDDGSDVPETGAKVAEATAIPGERTP